MQFSLCVIVSVNSILLRVLLLLEKNLYFKEKNQNIFDLKVAIEVLVQTCLRASRPCAEWSSRHFLVCTVGYIVSSFNDSSENGRSES